MEKHRYKFRHDAETQAEDEAVGRFPGDPDVELEVRCGYGSCKPEALQKCNNPKMMLLVMCLFTFTQGFIVNGVTNVNIIPLERRFQLSSSRSAVIASSYDFSAAIVGLVVSYLGSGRNKARWLAGAAAVMASASLTMSLPHFTTGLYQWGQGVKTTCSFNGTADGGCGERELSSLQNYQILLVLGMVMFGVGGAILFTIGIAYIDDSVPAVEAPLYIGLVYTASVLGPGAGYIAGGQLLEVYVDADKVDTSTIPLTSSDSRWVGAWWISYVVAMAMFAVVVLLLSCFGVEMPTAKRVRESRVSQLHRAESDTPTNVDPSRPQLREVPAILLALVKNPAFSLTCLAQVPEAINILGFSTFGPKFAATQFKLSSGRAALLSGAVFLPGAAGGMFLGGLICKRFKLKVKGMLKWILVTSSISGVMYGFLWISCGETTVTGVFRAYPNQTQTGSLTAACNQECHCNTDFYEPVCSGSDVEYFSPCHAGCLGRSTESTRYTNCSCLDNEAHGTTSDVASGNCESSCTLLPGYLVLLLVMTLTSFLIDTPADIVLLRSIQENHRTFSIGVSRCFIRILGSAVGPVLFGTLTDAACLVWKTECGEKSSCWLYDNFAMRRNFFSLAVGCKTFSLLCFLLAHTLYVPPKHTTSLNVSENDVTRASEEREMDSSNSHSHSHSALKNPEILQTNSNDAAML